MKILQLVNRVPYPPNDGGNIGVLFFSEGFLEAGVHLSMLAMNTTRHWVSPESLPEIFNQMSFFETVKVDNRIRIIPAMLNLFSNKSYNISRFYTKDYEQALIKLLKKEHFDIIQLEGVFLMPYISVIRKYSKAKVSLRAHNIEYVIWERLAGQESNLIKKQYLSLLARRLKRFEQASLNQVDLVLPISAHDRQTAIGLGVHTKMKIVPFGLDLSQIPFFPNTVSSVSLYHLGAMDWQPNQEAVLFLLEKVMPLVIAELPDIQLHLGGRNMPESFYRFQNKNVVIHGEVPDAVEFEKDKSLLVVPLLSGGGVRIKIFKAMAMGKSVVATPIGMEGIEITNGVHAVVAKDAAEMAVAIINLVRHPEKIEEMGRRARSFIQSHYDRKVIINELLSVYQRLLTD